MKMMRDDDHDATVDFDAHDIDARFKEGTGGCNVGGSAALHIPFSGFESDKC